MTTIAHLLFGSTGSRASLERALKFVTGPAGRFKIGGLSLPTKDVAAALAATLEMPLGTLALQGWKHNQQIVAARDRTRTDPEARETVRLLDHVIKTTQHPEVVVEVNGVPTTVLELTLVVRMKVSTADLVIERGEISQATPGSSTAEATLLAGTVVLAKKELGEADVTPP